MGSCKFGKIDCFTAIFRLFFVLFVTARCKNDFSTFIEDTPFDTGLARDFQEFAKSLAVMLTRPSHFTLPNLVITAHSNLCHRVKGPLRE